MSKLIISDIEQRYFLQLLVDIESVFTKKHKQ